MKLTVSPSMISTFGGRVATLRQLNNMTQLELAEQCAKRGIALSQGYLSRLENDKRKHMTLPNAGIVLVLADILDTTTDFLLGRTNDPTSLPRSPLLTDEAREAARIVDGLSALRRQEAMNVLRLIDKASVDLQEYYAKERRLLDSIERLVGKEVREQIAATLRDDMP